jgi:hypothetical protein
MWECQVVVSEETNRLFNPSYITTNVLSSDSLLGDLVERRVKYWSPAPAIWDSLEWASQLSG